MLCFVLIVTTLTSYVFTTSGELLTSYKAAVYEHKVIIPPAIPLSRDEAVEHMMKNLRIYEAQTQKASEQGANIIVFPEDGIYGVRLKTRDGIKPYLEFIPPVGVKWNPCLEPSAYKQTEVQQFLSCLARKSSIYIVANMGDKQPCDTNGENDQCPPDGQYQYNTDIVYDSNGNYVTKYHKYNLFYEYQFDKPATYEVISFEAPFGRFGLITCFDVLFQHPGMDLIKKQNITNIVFPTAWMDAEPFLSAIQFHSAFAIGLGINFLSANIHFPEFRFHGSGLYTPYGAASYYYDNSVGSAGKLIVTTLPDIEKRNSIPKPGYVIPEHAVTGDNALIYKAREMHQVLFHDNFSMIPLSSNTDTVQVCQNSLCCTVTYEHIYNHQESHYDKSVDLNDDVETDFYAVGAFDGLHTYQGNYYIQVCTVILCRSHDHVTCGETVGDQTSFSEIGSFTLSGNFSTNYIYPEILLSDNTMKRLSKYPNNWTYKDKVLSAQTPFESTLTVAAMFSRVYEKDNTV